MNLIEIISGVALLVSSILLIVVILMQDPKSTLSGAVGGGQDDSFFARNKGKTRAGMLERLTKILAVVIFLVALLVNGVAIWFK